MSNLPVLWVPPVTPPDPDERPPRRRGNRGVLMAAMAILATPLLAVAVFGENAGRPETAVAPMVEKAEAPVSAKIAPTMTVASQDGATAAPSSAAPSIGPAPDTSGGNQPYMAAPIPAKTAAETPTTEAPRVVGPDGRPVRVIGLDRKAEDREPAAVVPSRPPVAEPAVAPATAETPPASVAPIEAAAPRGTISEPAPSRAEPAPPQAASTPTAPTPAPPTPAPPTPTASAPAAPTVVRAEPAPAEPDPILRVDPAPRSSESKAEVVAPVEPPPVAPKAVEAARPVPPSAAPKTGEAKPVAPKVTTTRPTEPGATKVPPPPKRETAAKHPPAAENDDFADRLAAIRREESRRVLETPPPAFDDEEEIVVVPSRPRRWGILPPFFEGPARGPVLRSFEEPPPREVMRRAPQEENCHYHAWPTEDMAFHRTVRCHWHRDAGEPSIRYVR